MHMISEFLIQLELLHWTPELPQRLSLAVGDFLNQCALGGEMAESLYTTIVIYTMLLLTIGMMLYSRFLEIIHLA